MRGYRPEQPCWAIKALRNHALEAVIDNFADDWSWAVHATHAIHFLSPASIQHIERIVAEHVESQTGAVPTELYQDRGWNPADALWFDDRAGQYWRCYRAYTRQAWSSVEVPIGADANPDLWPISGYQFDGARGCVRRLQLNKSVSVDSTDAEAEAFIRAGDSLIARACNGADTAPLWHAVRAHTSFNGLIGSTNARFDLLVVPPDWTQRACEQREFRLVLEHVQTAERAI